MNTEWLEQLARIIEASRRVLMDERLMHGAWGKTMQTYLRLTQPAGSWKPEQLDLYRRCGSVTHTHHALMALRTYHELLGMPFPVAEATSVEEYMATWQDGAGDVPSPVTNIAEGMPSADPLDPNWLANRVAWANMLRHTGTALTSMLTLTQLLDVEPVRTESRDNSARGKMWKTIDKRWSEEVNASTQCQGHLHGMAKLATKSLARGARKMADRILLDDGTWPKVVYSPAYVVVAVHEGNVTYGRYLDASDRRDLEAFEDFLLNYLAEHGLAERETYLCQNRHPNSCFYYTLVILDHYLDVIYKRIRRDRNQPPAVKAILRMAEELLLRLDTISKRCTGLPMGLPQQGLVAVADPGTTARFALVVQKLKLCLEEDSENLPSKLNEASELAQRTSIEMVDSGLRSADLMTQSFEALIRLIECLTPDAKESLRSRLLDMNAASSEVGMTDDFGVSTIVTRVTKEAGIADHHLTVDLVKRLLLNEHFRDAVGADVTLESLLARFSNPILFYDLLDNTFNEDQLKNFCGQNNVILMPSQHKQQIIRILMNQFELGTPPTDTNERQIASELLRIERVLRTFVEKLIPDHNALRSRLETVQQHRRGTDAKNELYPQEDEDPIWRDVEFGDLWNLISWRWDDAKKYFASEFYGGSDGERRKVVHHHLEQLRRIRNRVFHLHGNISASRDIVDDRKLLDVLGTQLCRTLEEAIVEHAKAN
ncbi:MAG TPA: hypothetical protein VN956_26425 [Pyrinomonadaceae bacterium]|nr:hypothetical protein [Pyrinomonadaceae bacterium]